MKINTYHASHIPLSGIPWRHCGNNGNSQKSVLVRTTTKTRLAELLGTTTRYLREYGSCSIREDYAYKVPKDETIYYEPGCTRDGYIEGYVELIPETCRHDFNYDDIAKGKETYCRKCGVLH